jgi:hypothetical protein
MARSDEPHVFRNSANSFTEKSPVHSKASSIAEGEPPAWPFDRSREEAALRLERTTWGGRLVSFSVELDGRFAGNLDYGATLELEIPPGEHRLAVWGGGALVGTSERFLAQPYQRITYTVGYSWYGGVRLSRVGPQGADESGDK